MALDLPDGSGCFLDANILYYHFVDTPGVSDLCSDLLERISDDQIIAFASAHVLAEAIHKIMLAEAAKRFSKPRARLVNWLENNRERIMELDEFRVAAVEMSSLNVGILPLDLALLSEATELSKRLGLLTNDSIVVALMQRNNIKNLVTNDDDFSNVPGIKVWHPR